MNINEFISKAQTFIHKSSNKLVYGMEITALRGDSVQVSTIEGNQVLINLKQFKNSTGEVKIKTRAGMRGVPGGAVKAVMPTVGGWIYLDHIETSRVRLFDTTHANLHHLAAPLWQKQYTKVGK